MTIDEAISLRDYIKEQNFYQNFSFTNEIDKFLVIGKKGRFEQNKFTVYEIRVTDNKITYECVIKSFSKLAQAKDLLLTNYNLIH